MPAKSLAQVIGAGFRDKDKIVSSVTRHLMVTQGESRRTGYIHPSRLAQDHFCPRFAYYEITGVKPEGLPRTLAMELVFERGNDSHRTWQTWFWDMGRLRGVFRCLFCELRWEADSPTVCPRCDVGRDLLAYDEVPVFSEEYLLAGHADGDVLTVDDGWSLVEIKTIGPGTVRFEAPKLLDRYSYVHIDNEGKSHNGVDWYALWSGIRVPFPAHLRQGMIYCFCAGRKKIIFIYDPKFLTAYPKEFEVKFDKSLIEDRLEDCIVVRDAVEAGRPPKRPLWADRTCRTCQGCPFRGTCWNDSGRNRGAVEEESRRQSGAGEEGSSPSRKAKIRYASAPYESDRSR